MKGSSSSPFPSGNGIEKSATDTISHTIARGLVNLQATWQLALFGFYVMCGHSYRQAKKTTCQWIKLSCYEEDYWRGYEHDGHAWFIDYQDSREVAIMSLKIKCYIFHLILEIWKSNKCKICYLIFIQKSNFYQKCNFSQKIEIWSKNRILAKKV